MKEFQVQLIKQRTIFPLSKEQITLDQIISKQTFLLHGEDRSLNKFVPKILQFSVKSIKQALDNDPS